MWEQVIVLQRFPQKDKAKPHVELRKKNSMKNKFLQNHGARPEAYHVLCESQVSWQAGKVKCTKVRAAKKADLLASSKPVCVWGGISPKTLRRVLSSLLVPPRTSLSFCMSFCSHRAATRFSPPIKTELHLPLALLRSDFGLCRCRFTLQAPTCHLAGVDAIITQLVWSPLSLDWEEQATTVLSPHPHWAAAFLLHLELVTEEVKHCKYIFKT